jgi:hypothetical protein
MLEAIETALPFWVVRLGFQKIVEVPEGDKLGFVILQRDGAELMLQTWASVANDVAVLEDDARKSKTMLFIEVQDFEEFVGRLEGVPPIVPIRTTFYGMKEILVRDPGGNVVCFAAKVQ